MKGFICVSLDSEKVHGPKTNAEIVFVKADNQDKAEELIHKICPLNTWSVFEINKDTCSFKYTAYTA